ncbi:Protein-lysine N-methyltransferase EFM4 [Golovinomyces cichoracearum]|uniref:Protein-lysine N-methyltransferase EFM4 n=1 Tax=Golovinomyces cichoracearum TaxID=62708 RepID=A0A420HJF4_9PEZI|nr:Protein-lysine N-methyltransferase EFM4 [Golovinomyces cichoracearum]
MYFANIQSSTKYLQKLRLAHIRSWDDLYVKEIASYDEDAQNEGTIWFDDSAAEERMLEYLEEKICETQILGEHICRENCSFLDLGTGNGHFLFQLRTGSEEASIERRGWNGRMLGVDFSEKSIEFARRIGSEKKGKDIEFKQCDIMMTDPTEVINTGQNMEGWDVVLDKGTFDAISLSYERDNHGRRIHESYCEKICPLVKKGGIFLITSCNWTEEELLSWFCGPELVHVDTIKYNSFSFGGRTGQTVNTVCFRKEIR